MLKKRPLLLIAIFWGVLVFLCCIKSGDEGVTPAPHAIDVEEYPSVELQLMGVRIGAPYYKTKKQLTKKYGKPISRDSYDAFYLDKKTDNALLISTGIIEPHAVESIMVIGTHPVKDLDFFANIQLGDSEEKIPLLFPKAFAIPQKAGNCQYHILNSNYSISTKNGVVNFLSLSNLYVTTIRAGDQSIGLSEPLHQMASEQGLLTEPINIDKLSTFLEDPLRPYCESRYPLRQAPHGSSFVDVNLFQNEKSKPVPGTFLVDTGWSIAAISQEICRKINCNPFKAKGLKLGTVSGTVFLKDFFSGGTVSIGSIHKETPLFIHMPLGLLEHYEKLDGILGNNVLQMHPLFINFKQGYLCFPVLPVSQIAQKLRHKKLEAANKFFSIRTAFYAKDQMLKDGTLDSGADITVLPKQNITYLNLKDLGVKWPIIGFRGMALRSSHGPIEIGWPNLGVTKKLNRVIEGSNSKRSLIGIDFLKHYVLGLDPKSDDVYLGE